VAGQRLRFIGFAEITGNNRGQTPVSLVNQNLSTSFKTVAVNTKILLKFQDGCSASHY
jgi:hypothetical protein